MCIIPFNLPPWKTFKVGRVWITRSHAGLTSIFPILQKRKLRLRGVKSLVIKPEMDSVFWDPLWLKVIFFSLPISYPLNDNNPTNFIRLWRISDHPHSLHILSAQKKGNKHFMDLNTFSWSSPKHVSILPPTYHFLLSWSTELIKLFTSFSYARGIHNPH